MINEYHGAQQKRMVAQKRKYVERDERHKPEKERDGKGGRHVPQRQKFMRIYIMVQTARATYFAVLFICMIDIFVYGHVSAICYPGAIGWPANMRFKERE